MKKRGLIVIIAFVVICGGLIMIKKSKIDIPFVKIEYRNNSILECSIGIYSGKDPYSFHEIEGMKNPVLTAADVSDTDASGVADPFMIFVANKWYLFFEVINNKSGKGDIGYSVSDNGLDWKYQKIVLNEPFHLSYPYIFAYDNEYYMIPETSMAKSIRLYKAKKFPDEWQLDSVLISGLSFVDPSIIKYDGKWWLFVAGEPNRFGTLRLYMADDLHGPWHEHTKSPIVEDNENIARPGGRVIIYENTMLRYTQDDSPSYGNQVRVFQINKLTSDEYWEHEYCGSPVLESGKIHSIAGNRVNWYDEGMHTIDPHEISDNHWIACVDGFTKTVKSKQLVLTVEFPFFKKD